MTKADSVLSTQRQTVPDDPPPIHYYVVMVDYGHEGRAAVVDLEITQIDVIDRVRTGRYGPVHFIHYIDGGACLDVTNCILKAAGFYDDVSADTAGKAVQS
jgi:hypothetical protein